MELDEREKANGFDYCVLLYVCCLLFNTLSFAFVKHHNVFASLCPSWEFYMCVHLELTTFQLSELVQKSYSKAFRVLAHSWLCARSTEHQITSKQSHTSSLEVHEENLHWALFIHCFAGSWIRTRNLLAQGLTLTVATFRRSHWS